MAMECSYQWAVYTQRRENTILLNHWN